MLRCCRFSIESSFFLWLSAVNWQQFFFFFTSNSTAKQRLGELSMRKSEVYARNESFSRRLFSATYKLNWICVYITFNSEFFGLDLFKWKTFIAPINWINRKNKRARNNPRTFSTYFSHYVTAPKYVKLTSNDQKQCWTSWNKLRREILTFGSITTSPRKTY